MKIETMSMDLFRKLWDLWSTEPLSDEMKGQDPFRYMLCETDDIPWYLVDDTVFVIYKLRPGWDAELLTLNLHRVPRDKGFNELQQIFADFELQRLTLPVPYTIKKTKRAAHRLGFRMEGKLRDATVYEGIFQDLALLGAHRETFEGSGPPDPPVRPSRRDQETEDAPEARGVEAQSGPQTEVDA
jgi:hypothetical protein